MKRALAWMKYTGWPWWIIHWYTRSNFLSLAILKWSRVLNRSNLWRKKKRSGNAYTAFIAHLRHCSHTLCLTSAKHGHACYFSTRYVQLSSSTNTQQLRIAKLLLRGASVGVMTVHQLFRYNEGFVLLSCTWSQCYSLAQKLFNFFA